jgi:hypothetical protein
MLFSGRRGGTPPPPSNSPWKPPLPSLGLALRALGRSDRARGIAYLRGSYDAIVQEIGRRRGRREAKPASQFLDRSRSRRRRTNIDDRAVRPRPTDAADMPEFTPALHDVDSEHRDLAHTSRKGGAVLSVSSVEGRRGNAGRLSIGAQVQERRLCIVDAISGRMREIVLSRSAMRHVATSTRRRLLSRSRRPYRDGEGRSVVVVFGSRSAKMAGTIPHAEERRRYGRGIGIRCHGAKNGVRREDVESERGGRTVLRIGRRPTDVEREFARVHEGVLRRSDVHGMAVERGGECVLVFFILL